jgi:hypothetical protein
MNNDLRKAYRENMATGARDVFARHQISKRSEDCRWLLQRRYKDDEGWDGSFATEVVCVYGNGLLVGGDIDHVLFRYGPVAPLPRVYWMGAKENAWDSYFVEKAAIGSGRQMVETWNATIAQADLRELREEIGTEKDLAIKEGELRPRLSAQRVLDAISDIFGDRVWEEGRDAILSRLYQTGHFDDGLPTIGMIEDPRLFFVHAALQRLCTLLDEEHACPPKT